MKAIYLCLVLSMATFIACSNEQSNNAGEAEKTGATAPSTLRPRSVESSSGSGKTEYASAKEGWLVDVDEAYAISVKEGKPILANFTGSDWCGWCKKLDADVFTKPEFKEWSEKNVVLLELDFPRRFQIPPKNQSQNISMKNALRVSGFPTIWVLNLTKDASGEYQINGLGKAGYTPSVEQFIATVDGFVSM